MYQTLHVVSALIYVSAYGLAAILAQILDSHREFFAIYATIFIGATIHLIVAVHDWTETMRDSNREDGDRPPGSDRDSNREDGDRPPGSDDSATQ